MARPAVSLNFSAFVASSVSSGSRGDVLIPSESQGDAGGYVKATTANRNGRRSYGVALDDYAGNSAVRLATGGFQLDPEESGLSAGTEAYARVSSAGRLERVAFGSAADDDDIMGTVAADGSVFLNPGLRRASGNAEQIRGRAVSDTAPDRGDAVGVWNEDDDEFVPGKPTPPGWYNAFWYGSLVADDTSAPARAANQAAIEAAIAAMGPAPTPSPSFTPTAWPGGVLTFPPGVYYLEDTLFITRSIELRGHSASNGMFWAQTVLCFPPGKRGLVPEWVLDSADGGRGDGCVIKNIALCSGTWSVGNATGAWERWAPSTAYADGDVVIPAQWSKWGYAFVCTTAGTSGSSDSFFPGKDMREIHSDIEAEGTTYNDNGVVWELVYAHGIDIRATSVVVENVYIRSFAGNGINVATDQTVPGGGGANLFVIRRPIIDVVGGHGVLVDGNDVNVSWLDSASITDCGGFGAVLNPGLCMLASNLHVRDPQGGFAYWFDRCTVDNPYAEGGAGPIHAGTLAKVDSALAGSGAFDGYSDDYRQVWGTGQTITAGDTRRPTTPNGYYYRADGGGTTHAATEPTWPTRAGSTVTDNGITWRRWGIWGDITASDPAWGQDSGANGVVTGSGQGRRFKQITAPHSGYQVSVQLAPGGSVPVRYGSTEDPNGCTGELNWDQSSRSWYWTIDSAQQLMWWPGPNATSTFRPYVVSFPNGVGLGRGNIDGAAFTNSYPRLASATRVPTGGEGTWRKGDFIFNNDPAAASVLGFRCVSGGDPGTWETVHYSGVQVETTFQSTAVWRDSAITGTTAPKVAVRSRRTQTQTTTSSANQVIDNGNDTGSGEDFVLPASSMTRIAWLVTVKKTSTAHGGTIEVKADYVRDGSGAPTLIGAETITYNLTGSTLDGTTVNLNVNGNRVELRASPESADTLNWRIIRTQYEGTD